MKTAPVFACLTSLVLGASLAQAQDTVATPGIAIELNAVQTQDNSCRLSFVVQNTHAAEISNAVYETVLFDATGQVERMTLLDFGTLPPARPRVRQFVLSGVSCDDLSQILINGAHACVAAGLEKTACTQDIKLTTRTNIEVTG
ncbi:hypothetical protein [Roseovarius sp. EL26]|uniref:hypothetical protein n=1 Tax=Roseovarius sp. EL26 TaxID=2126672 RepID=UPI000EA35B94|nr:hypothetical protein [Roseovarius sp. EL26]